MSGRDPAKDDLHPAGLKANYIEHLFFVKPTGDENICAKLRVWRDSRVLGVFSRVS
jgi:hypothetical protein